MTPSLRIDQRRRRAWAALALPALLASPAHAAVAPDTHLADLSLEQLSNIVVMSVSRREESLANAPASIFVISNEDIRRSGVTSLPEALRLAPNLQVARADTNQYAISARGFNNVLANKLLVMIDGRTVYSPLFSGTFWEAQDVMLEDIDRIEVISGPGATLWGANAVNGVINIITRAARDTQGALVAGAVGTSERGGAVRYGGVLGNDGFYRAYGRYFHRDNSEFANGTPIRDASDRAQGGFRADWSGPVQSVTLQGDVYTGTIDQAPSTRDISGANVLARWIRRFEDGSISQVQAYYDYTHRRHPNTFEEHLSTFDLEAQYGTKIGAVQELVVGAGYRYAADRVVNSAVQAFIPPERHLQWANVYVQDQIALSNDVDLILGAKVETNVYTHAEFLPSARLAWRPAPAHMLWAAASRAVRSPARIERDYNVPGAKPFVLTGNDTYDSEVANVYELGYRSEPTPNVSYTVTLFLTDYDRLRSLQPQIGGAIFANGIEGTSTGIEAWGTWRVTSSWKLFAGITGTRERWHVVPGRVDIGGLTQLGNDPAVQWNLRSAWDVTPRFAIDVMARSVSALPNPAVPAYTAVDARLVWRATPKLEISLNGQNLFDPRHAEWGPASNRAEFERNATLGFLWTP